MTLPHNLTWSQWRDQIDTIRYYREMAEFCRKLDSYKSAMFARMAKDQEHWLYEE